MNRRTLRFATYFCFIFSLLAKTNNKTTQRRNKTNNKRKQRDEAYSYCRYLNTTALLSNRCVNESK